MNQQIDPNTKESSLASSSPNSLSAKPLIVITNPSGDYVVSAGEFFELRVTISNQGNIGAVINLYIDETSQLSMEWCDSPFESLALGSNHSGEVVFRFNIPVQAVPNSYNYLLVIDAPKHYPEDTPIRHQARLQVLPPVQSAVRVNDPTFAVLPATSTAKPAILTPGQPLSVRVLVHNRSDRVDRFRLTCPDLSLDWFTIVYPEGISDLGLVAESESLALNPNTKGEILLQFNFPLGILAGRYSPTIRVNSENNSELFLLDVIYIQVSPIHTLNVELQTILGRVRKGSGLFWLTLLNGGNTTREVMFRLRGDSEEERFTYRLEPTFVRLAPQELSRVELEIKPIKWWRRPWFGRGLPLRFYLELEDSDRLPLSPNTLSGEVLWEARPWWQLLLLILAGMGAIAALVFLIWWLFFRPPASPKIQDFSSSEPTYQESQGDTIYLNWQIRHPKQLQTLKIVGSSPEDGTVNTQPLNYDFSKGIPNPLKAFCTERQRLLTCQNIRTDARKSGNYIFTMEVSSKRGDGITDSRKTNTIKIEPVALPKITELTSTQPTYQEVGESSKIKNSDIRLNWKISNPEQLQELQLIGRGTDGTVSRPLRRYDISRGIPPQLKEFCTNESNLVCKNIPTGTVNPGDYIFELALVPKRGGGEVVATKKTDTIKIKAKQVPSKIISFKVNNQEALPKYLVPINAAKPAIILVLSWKVEGGKDAKVELLPAPGTVNLEGIVPYPISQKSGTETITLQVTSSGGKQINRSVTIETYDPSLIQADEENNRVPLPSVVIPPPRISPPSPIPPSPVTNRRLLPIPRPSGLSPSNTIPSAKPTVSPSIRPSPVLGTPSPVEVPPQAE